MNRMNYGGNLGLLILGVLASCSNREKPISTPVPEVSAALHSQAAPVKDVASITIPKEAFPYGRMPLDEGIYKAHFDTQIDRLINAPHSKFVPVFNEVFNGDAALHGDDALLESFGIFAGLHQSIVYSAGVNDLKYWQITAGKKLYVLLQKTKDLPDSSEFAKAKAGIFGGAINQYLPAFHESRKQTPNSVRQQILDSYLLFLHELK